MCEHYIVKYTISFSIKTGDLQQISDFRAIIRSLFIGGKTYETFPKLALIKKYSLTIYLPASISGAKPNKCLRWLRSCNRKLQGKMWSINTKKFPKSHPRAGARIVAITGDQQFLDSLHRFPRDYPFDIKIANLYIRGGQRTDKEHTYAGKAAKALKKLPFS